LNWPTCHAWQSLNNFMLQKMCVWEWSSEVHLSYLVW
jgi:hypothetical protein